MCGGTFLCVSWVLLLYNIQTTMKYTIHMIFQCTEPLFVKLHTNETVKSWQYMKIGPHKVWCHSTSWKLGNFLKTFPTIILENLLNKYFRKVLENTRSHDYTTLTLYYGESKEADHWMNTKTYTCRGWQKTTWSGGVL